MDENESIRERFKHRECLSSHRDSAAHDNAIDDRPLTSCPHFKKVTTTYQKPAMCSLFHRLNASSCTQIVKLITVLVMAGFVNTASAESVVDNQNSFSTSSKDTKSRTGKSLFFDNPLNDMYFNNQYQNEDLLGNNEEYDGESDDVMSRARPLGNKKKYADSPIYYIRIPPSPYVHVPGYGYVSEPQSLKPPPQVVQNEPSKYSSHGYNQNYVQTNQNYQRPAPNYMSSINSLPSYMQPQQNYNYNSPANSYFSDYQNPVSSLSYQENEYSGGGVYPANTYPLGTQNFPGSGAHNKYHNSPIYNLPLQFLANGKPTHIYTLDNEIQATPMKPSKPTPPDSPIYNLDKGPYVFNGKPADSIFLLRNAYNDLYDETINNFYP